MRVHEDDAPDYVASLLDVEAPARVWVRSRRFVLDDKPVLLSASCLPADLVAGSPITQPGTGSGGTYARLAELGHAPVRFVRTMEVYTHVDEVSRRQALGKMGDLSTAARK